MVTIKKIAAREIIDSRANPTIETKVILSDDSVGTVSIPSGASVGKYEAFELRDNDPQRYLGMGVLNAVKNVNELIGPKIIGQDPIRQGKIDEMLIQYDGTQNKSKLGANAVLSVSLAVCKAAAQAVNLPLYKYINVLLFGKEQAINKIPIPIFNIINGGKHGAGNLDFQEFQVIPASTKSYHESLRLGVEVYQQLKKILIERNAIHSVGDEGGYAPNLFTNLDALEAIMEAIRTTKYKFGLEVFLGLDLASSHFKKDNLYYIKDRQTAFTSEEFIDFLINLHHDYHLLVLEDPLAEDDWKSWHNLLEKIGREVLLVGDDLLATNPERLKKAISEKVCSAILVKPNQIGTLSETLAVIKIAQSNDIKIDVSHRSGETNDTFISDLAVGINADYVKFGAPARGERVAKYNRLLEIEKELK